MLIARFEIDELPPRASAHYMVRHGAKQRWAEHFGWQATQQNMQPALAPVKRVVIVEFLRPSAQEMDIDNLHGMLKVPLDVCSRAHGRKTLGIAAIWDDAPAFVDVYPFCVNHPFRRTVVTICSDGSAPEDYRVAAQQQAMEI